MPKLIIDDAAMQLLVSKASGQPIYSGPDSKFLSPGVIDVINLDNDWDKWQPGGETSRLLVLGVEACCELLFQAERFKEEAYRRRTIKSMTVPLCSLMDQVNKLLSLLNDDESKKTRETWPMIDQSTYKNIGRQFRKKRFDGPVRQVRNKLAAHLDQDVIGDPKFQLGLEDFLSALGDSLILFMLVMKHSKAFSWIRWLGSSQRNNFQVVETLFEYPLCVRWLTDNEGRVIDVGCLQLAEDPCWKLQEYVIQAIERYNTLVDESGVQVSKIWTAPSAEIQMLKEQE